MKADLAGVLVPDQVLAHNLARLEGVGGVALS